MDRPVSGPGVRGGSIDVALSDDEIHPVTAGYELMEQILQPYLEELL